MNKLRKKKEFLDHFPVPKILLLSTAGVSVSDGMARFVEFRRSASGHGLELVHCGEVPVPEGAIESGSIINQSAVSAAIKELCSKYGAKFARATLPEENSYLFNTIIESVSSSNMRDAIAFILEENVPLALDQAVFDYNVIGQGKDDSELRVAVSVAPRQLVESYINAFEGASVTPISFDLESQAIARSVVPMGDTRTHLLISLHNHKTGLYVVSDELVEFSSTPSFGVLDDLLDLKSEVRKLFTFWDNRNGGDGTKKIEKVIISGSGATNGEFVKALMSEVEVEWDLANVWVNAFSVKDKVPDVPFEESLGFAPAIGLALPRVPRKIK